MFLATRHPTLMGSARPKPGGANRPILRRLLVSEPDLRLTTARSSHKRHALSTSILVL
jgi:hypothetical protein